MRKKMQIALTTLGLCALLILGFSFLNIAVERINFLLSNKHGESTINQDITVGQGLWNWEATENVSGKVTTERGHNTYTNIGKLFSRDLAFWANVTQNATYGKIGWVSLSNDASPSATWTKLANELTASGSGRKAWTTTSNVNDTCINGTVTFSFSGTVTFQTVGIQWSSTASSDNNLFAVFSVTQITWNSGDSFTVKYYKSEGGT